MSDPAEHCTEVAATVIADVESLAPVVAEQVSEAIEEADPTLDDDVAAWFDGTAHSPGSPSRVDLDERLVFAA